MAPTLLSRVISTVKDSGYLANLACIELMSREQYHREYGGCEPDYYSHVLLNSARFTVPQAAELLCGIARQHFGL